MMKQLSRSSTLIRIPEHDSLSAMVLEMLARGRHVIYNKVVEGCSYASNLAEACEALRGIQSQREPNQAGARYVRKNFSLQKEAAVLAGVYTWF